MNNMQYQVKKPAAENNPEDSKNDETEGQENERHYQKEDEKDN